MAVPRHRQPVRQVLRRDNPWLGTALAQPSKLAPNRRKAILPPPQALLDNPESILRVVQTASAVASMAGSLWLLNRQINPDLDLFALIRGGKNKPVKSTVTFADVAGVDEAKFELQEIVDFLKNPERYEKLGARIPRGCLLEGPAGTGKTLLAKAVAGEAGVPFLYASASQFVEIFVGQGAKRVRELFNRARQMSPCIIFIDEIDAVGGERHAGPGGGNEERSQTLNELLTQMDGFATDSKVIVIAATNRADMLDAALLRPGRFDRHVRVSPADLKGREAILATHTRERVLASDVDLHAIALLTAGFSGADLANLANEAAIRAARAGLDAIGQAQFMSALDRILMGSEVREISRDPAVRRLTALHEAGHAILATLLEHTMPVRYVTIQGQGGSGGATHFVPSEDQAENHMPDMQVLKDDLAVALGGRIAEQLMLGDGNETTGAVSDLQHASRQARRMVTQYGMGPRIGSIMLEDPTQRSTLLDICGPELQNAVGADVRALIDEAQTRARQTLRANRVVLEGVTAVLIDKGRLEGDELRMLIARLQTLTLQSDK